MKGESIQTKQPTSVLLGQADLPLNNVSVNTSLRVQHAGTGDDVLAQVLVPETAVAQ